MCEHLEIVPPLRCDACNAAGLAPDLCDAADEFLDEALTILKPGGIIHYYDGCGGVRGLIYKKGIWRGVYVG
jgi:tRNA G37 N-methylase Trm5